MTKNAKFIFLAAFLLICAVGGYVFLWEPSLSVQKVDRGQRASDLEPAVDGVDVAGVRLGQKHDTYLSLYEKYSDGTLKGDPVAIDKFMRLIGACESGVKVMPGIDVPMEVERLRGFCAMHASNKDEFANLWSQLSKDSYTSQLKEKLRYLEESTGKDAVRRELSAELKSANADQAQMSLEYAAESALVPEELDPLIDARTDMAAAKKLSILSQIEFCRRGGDCGARDFPAIAACVSLPPCPTQLGLLDVIRRSSAPRDYEAAVRMSEALHKSH